jgi:predicted nucleic acid-binding protein
MENTTQNMENIIENNKYVTSDLYLTAYLKTKGFKYEVIKLRSKSNFAFIESPELLSNVNEYLSETGSCEPLAYTNAIKNLKNYLFNNK